MVASGLFVCHKTLDSLTIPLHICPNNGIDALLLLRWEILFIQEGLRSE